MNVALTAAPIGDVAALAGVSIAFRVERVGALGPRNDETGTFEIAEQAVAVPYFKDYDAISGEGPRQWAHHFDISPWGFIRADENGQLVGGVVIAFRTPEISLLDGRDDLAVIWDLRVAPTRRGQGVGSALFRAAEAWAVARGCTELKVETQDINVPACRLYARCGGKLRTANPHAYPEFPSEIQLLWFKRLPATSNR